MFVPFAFISLASEGKSGANPSSFSTLYSANFYENS